MQLLHNLGAGAKIPLHFSLKLNATAENYLVSISAIPYQGCLPYLSGSFFPHMISVNNLEIPDFFIIIMRVTAKISYSHISEKYERMHPWLWLPIWKVEKQGTKSKSMLLFGAHCSSMKQLA